MCDMACTRMNEEAGWCDVAVVCVGYKGWTDVMDVMEHHLAIDGAEGVGSINK